jgi:hypothetical protein
MNLLTSISFLRIEHLGRGCLADPRPAPTVARRHVTSVGARHGAARHAFTTMTGLPGVIHHAPGLNQAEMS